MKVTPEEFGKRLREYRRYGELTLVELSGLSGISQPYLSQLENGKSGIPSPEILKKIADALPSHSARYSHLLEAAGYEELAEAIKRQEILDDFSPALDHDLDPAYLKGQVKFITHVVDIKTFIENDYFVDNSEDGEWFRISPKYNGHLLTAKDRQRILLMMTALFPEYQEAPMITRKKRTKGE